MTQVIHSRAQLQQLARELGMRPDWHEPDEQMITATVHGDSFDNAMSPGHWYYGQGRDGEEPHAELYVTLRRIPEQGSNRHPLDPMEPVAVVNLATLFAWACGYDS